MSTLIISLLFTLLGLNPNYIGHCLLNSPSDEKVPLYEDATGSKIIAYIVNDGYYEDYPDLYIKEKRNGRVLVDAKYIIWDKRHHEDESGWLDINYLGVYLNEGILTKNIYATPSRDSKIVFKIKRNEFAAGKYEVYDVDNYWLKIKVTGTDVIGWLPPEFSETTAEDEDPGRLPVIFIKADNPLKIPIYDNESGNTIKDVIFYDPQWVISPHIQVLNLNEGSERAQGYICDGKGMVNLNGWINKKYLVTYLNPECEKVNAYDSYEGRSILFVINNTKKSKAYPVIETGYFGWVKILDPNSHKKGWISPNSRSEDTSTLNK